MAKGNVKICPDCKEAIVGLDGQQCTYCNLPMPEHVIGDCEPIVMELRGSEPDEATAVRLSGGVFARKGPTKEELKTAMFYLFSFIMAAGISVGCYFVVRDTSLEGGLMKLIKLVSWVVQLVGPFIAVFLFISFLNMLFRDARKKDVAKAINWVLREAYLSARAGEPQDRFSKTEYALGCLLRGMPDDRIHEIGKSNMERYIELLRGEINTRLDNTAKDVLDQDFKLRGDTVKIGKVFTIQGFEVTDGPVTVTQVNDHIAHASGIIGLELYASCTIRDKTVYLTLAKMNLSITAAFIKRDRYWFIYDPMPQI